MSIAIRLVVCFGFAFFGSFVTAAQGPQSAPRVPGEGAALFGPQTLVTQLGTTTFPGGESLGNEDVTCSVQLPSGAVVLAGQTSGSLGEANAGQSDVFVARISRTGVLQWVLQIGAATAPSIPALNGQVGGPGGDASSYDSVGDMILDSDGTLLVTGSTFTSLGETNAGFGGDFFVARITVQGDLLWLRQIGVETAVTIVPATGASTWGDSSGNDYGNALLADPTGGFWVAGFTSSSLSEQNVAGLCACLAHFDDNGFLDGFQQIGEVHAPLLGVEWERNIHLVYGIAMAPEGPLVAVTTETYSGTDLFSAASFLRFDHSGMPISAVAAPATISAIDAVGMDMAGRVYVTGTYLEFVSILNFQYDAAVACYDPMSAQWIWSTRLDESSGTPLGLIDLTGNENPNGIAVDDQGVVFVAGTTTGSLDDFNAGQGDFFAMELDAVDGNVRSVRQLGAASAARSGRDLSGNELAGDLFLSADGLVGITGTTTSDLAEPSGFIDAVLLRLLPNLQLD